MQSEEKNVGLAGLRRGFLTMTLREISSSCCDFDLYGVALRQDSVENRKYT